MYVNTSNLLHLTFTVNLSLILKNRCYLQCFITTVTCKTSSMKCTTRRHYFLSCKHLTITLTVTRHLHHHFNKPSRHTSYNMDYLSTSLSFFFPLNYSRKDSAYRTCKNLVVSVKDKVCNKFVHEVFRIYLRNISLVDSRLVCGKVDNRARKAVLMSNKDHKGPSTEDNRNRNNFLEGNKDHSSSLESNSISYFIN